MITLDEATKLVEEYLKKQNDSEDCHVFEIPVYTNVLKIIGVSILAFYHKRIKKIPLDYPEWFIKPDSWKYSKSQEVVFTEYIKDLGICWEIPYGPIQLLESEEGRFQGIGGGPIFVDKENGLMYQTGSSPINWLESYKRYKFNTIKEDWPRWEPIPIEEYL